MQQAPVSRDAKHFVNIKTDKPHHHWHQCKNRSTIYKNYGITGLRVWCLTPLSAIFLVKETREKPPTRRKSLEKFIT